VFGVLFWQSGCVLLQQKEKGGTRELELGNIQHQQEDFQPVLGLS
jgi:hypothetical protein